MATVDKGGQTVSVTEFADLTGVSRDRLRTWERRFGFPAPVRHGAGRRRYRTEDVGRVVAVRRAAEDGVPLAVAIEQAGDAREPLAPSGAFRAALELAPVAVALVAGPRPMTLAWANAALRALPHAPAPGQVLDGFGALRPHFARELPALELEHEPWSGSGAPGRAVAYRVPVGPGEAPLVAVLGLETRGERDARAELLVRDAELGELARRAERHERWLDAIAGLAAEFQHEPGPDVIVSALDVLIRQTEAVDGGLATYVSGQLVVRGSRRGVLAAQQLTVAAHPGLARALRDQEGVWVDRTVARLLGVPDELHVAGIPIVVAGETLGLLAMVFDELEPHDRDNRRLLAAISAAMGFALLRDRLVSELQATVSREASRPAPPAAAG